MPDATFALLTGFALDLLLGDPEWLVHPVRLIGAYIAFAEKKLRARGGDLRRSAVALTASAVLLTMAVVALLLMLLRRAGRAPLFIGMAILDWLGLAARSLAKEARGVRSALEQGVEQGRRQVARIVGRDTQALDAEEIVKATVETVAESTCDGVISPLFWAAVGGPVALWGFKAASTLDSMVGYMDEHYRDIGWASARLDDALNYLPARLTALLMCLSALPAGLDARNALSIVRRDHANHSSPNCAWCEAAAAGAMHIQLGGAHEYFGKTVVKPTIGDADRPARPSDIEGAIALMVGSGLLAALIVALLSFLLRG